MLAGAGNAAHVFDQFVQKLTIDTFVTAREAMRGSTRSSSNANWSSYMLREMNAFIAGLK
jgi:hypothetical protein